ncbi:hypothetical protein GCM10022407_20410 [Hymenobacter antarcticus]|uniref:Uncharacterized protein n=1 Tax=Hymenobacter antarcticus TaxID=486270 RepID=A0ABP7Q0W5_9BACT
MVMAVVGLALAGAFHAHLQYTAVSGLNRTAADEQAVGLIGAIAQAIVSGFRSTFPPFGRLASYCRNTTRAVSESVYRLSGSPLLGRGAGGEVYAAAPCTLFQKPH